MLKKMNEKLDLFLDFDDTITLSLKQFFKVANKKFGTNKDWRCGKLWNFEDSFPDITYKDIDDIFSSDDFFLDLEIICGCKETLYRHKKCFNYNIATVGKKENLSRKSLYIHKNFKDLDFTFHGIEDSGFSKINKSSINMNNGIFIDDRADALRSSNAKIKVLFKDYRDYSWQEVYPNEDMYIVNSWKEIDEILKWFSQKSHWL